MLEVGPELELVIELRRVAAEEVVLEERRREDDQIAPALEVRPDDVDQMLHAASPRPSRDIPHDANVPSVHGPGRDLDPMAY